MIYKNIVKKKYGSLNTSNILITKTGCPLNEPEKNELLHRWRFNAQSSLVISITKQDQLDPSRHGQSRIYSM